MRVSSLSTLYLELGIAPFPKLASTALSIRASGARPSLPVGRLWKGLFGTSRATRLLSLQRGTALGGLNLNHARNNPASHVPRCSAKLPPPSQDPVVLTLQPLDEATQRISQEWINGPFVEWLNSRGEKGASDRVAVGRSEYGWGLVAIKPVRRGRPLLSVTRQLMITADLLPPDVAQLLPEKETCQYIKLSVFLLIQMAAGKASEWYPYISLLPPRETLHATLMWHDWELELLNGSRTKEFTVQRRQYLTEQHEKLQAVYQACKHYFPKGAPTLDDLKYAFTCVSSRAWYLESIDRLTMIPFCDFVNHDASVTAMLCYDDSKKVAEIEADRAYFPGEQIFSSYGKKANSNLLLDFGFTIPGNVHDTVDVWCALNLDDPLREPKMQLLRSLKFETQAYPDGKDSGGQWFELSYHHVPSDLAMFAWLKAVDSQPQLDALSTAARLAAADAKESIGRAARQEDDAGRSLLVADASMGDWDAKLGQLAAASTDAGGGRETIVTQIDVVAQLERLRQLSTCRLRESIVKLRAGLPGRHLLQAEAMAARLLSGLRAQGGGVDAAEATTSSGPIAAVQKTVGHVVGHTSERISMAVDLLKGELDVMDSCIQLLDEQIQAFDNGV